jgi:diacylglycerol kinase (ATP)
MRTCFIFNPQSGHNRRRPGLDRAIRDFIAGRSLDASLRVTEGPGHARELARDAVAAGAGVVVAVGGDGTMNEVAQALLHTPAALALVPCGSGNGLALHLGVPRALGQALDLATGQDGRKVELDTGEVNGRPFCNAMGVGLDAEVSGRFNRLLRRGLPAYARVAWQAWRERRPLRCTIEDDEGGRHELAALLVTVANSDQYGNQARIAPGARVDDGRLDLVVVRHRGLVRTLPLVPRLFLGTVDRSPLVWRRTGRRFVIERERPGLVHTDGETHEAGARLEVVVRPGSLRMIVPALSPAVRRAARLATSSFALQLP